MLHISDIADISSGCVESNVSPSRCTRRIALIYDAQLPFDRNVMSGVASYLRESGEFNIYIEENPLSGQKLPYLKSWQGDGILADFDDPKVLAAVSRLDVPVVGFGCGWHSPNSLIPYFSSNQSAVADMAADHLLERGFEHFAFCGFSSPANQWSKELQRAFAARLEARGFFCHSYQDSPTNPRHWDSVLSSVGSWVKSLPKPIGILAANDKRARNILEACQFHQLSVPDEVGVIGVDNDELFREFSNPQLTSVEQDAKRIGYEAIALLHRIMAGEVPVQRHYVIPPIGIRIRRSTDVLATDDRLAAKTLMLINSSVAEGAKVMDIVSSLSTSRSRLESHFRAATGSTIYATIRRVRLEQARRLISETSLAIKEIASETGFKSVQHMTTLFRKAFGQTPAKYRKGEASTVSHTAGSGNSKTEVSKSVTISRVDVVRETSSTVWECLP
jgi:LacI family transcriptional regulator